MYRYIIYLLLSVSPALAAGPNAVSYQGYIQNTDGTALSGTADLRMGVWSDPVSTANSHLLYLEQHDSVAVENGLFSLPLGGGTVQLGAFDANLFAESDRWLEVTVNGEALSPRTRFLSVPYALQARQAETLAGLSGAVMHFARTDCPQGWSELADARGRTIVGLPSNGSLGGTVGNAMTDLEARQHSHAVSTPAGTSGSISNHSHSVTTRFTSSDTHNHRWTIWNGSLNDWFSWNGSGNQITVTNWSNGMDQAGAGIYPLAASSSATTTIYTDQDSHSHTVNSFNTSSSGSHSHSTPPSSVVSAAASSNPALPYIQLLTCIKN